MHPIKALSLWLRYNFEFLQWGSLFAPGWQLINFERFLTNPIIELESFYSSIKIGKENLFSKSNFTGLIRYPIPEIPITLEGIDSSF